MDIPRKHGRRNKRLRQVVLAITGALAIGAGAFSLASLERPATKIALAQVTIGEVKRGDLLRDVPGYGSLVAKDVLYVPAPSNGRVDAVKVLAGTRVSSDDVLVVLSNPELELEVLNAEARLQEAQTARITTKASYESQYMHQKAAVASTNSNYLDAGLQAEKDTELHKEKLVSDLTRQRSQMRVDALKAHLAIEEELLATLDRESEAQLTSCDARIAQEGAALEFARQRVVSLTVRAGAEGVLRELLVQTGEQVQAGTSVAVVVDPAKLKAVIRVAESQVKDVDPGQVAHVFINGKGTEGTVTRVDPTVTEGTASVDIEFETELPDGVRPDLTVRGTIEIERLPDVLYMDRPLQCSANSSVGLFRLSPDGKTATRTSVRVGATSTALIEVHEGLSVGDRIILSDMSQWDGEETLRLE
jgi:multidrug resistance efflux pump